VPQAAPGAVRGSYRLVRRLGAGGTGEVWVGRHVVTNGVGAVKLLRARRGREQLRAMFKREAAVIARLQHPHIISLFELGDEHIVTALVDGSDLSRRMKQGIDPARAQRIGVQIGSALACAHAHGVVHHDVKPANILVDRNDNAFLGDFGLASSPDDGRPGSGPRGGTPGFMAPEQAKGGTTTAAVDQFSLARTLIEVIAGGTDRADVETALALMPPAAAPLRPVLERATREDPAARFPSMDAFVAELEAVALRDVPPVVRVAAEKRSTQPFAWLAHPTATSAAAPAMVRAVYSLSSLQAAGAISAAAAERFRAETGHADFAWTLWARSDRLGPLGPSLAARAGELVVLLHGFLGTRAVWDDLAPPLCRDNADAVVLAPDVNGFGGSPFSSPDAAHVSAQSLGLATTAWLRLVGLDGLPGVVVGHSMAGLGVLAAGPQAFGPKIQRVALTPAIFQITPLNRFAWRLNTALCRLAMRWRWVFLLLAWMISKPNAATKPLSKEQLLGFRREFERVSLAMLARFNDVMVNLVLPDDALAGVELIYGAKDPVLPKKYGEKAVARLGGSRDHAHLMASGGHNPHMISTGDPVGSQRNQSELTQIIGAVLLSAVDAAGSSTLALSQTS
jgi:pimeloyl-ACP methyl ester carboxylesterase